MHDGLSQKVTSRRTTARFHWLLSDRPRTTSVGRARYVRFVVAEVKDVRLGTSPKVRMAWTRTAAAQRPKWSCPSVTRAFGGAARWAVTDRTRQQPAQIPRRTDWQTRFHLDPPDRSTDAPAQYHRHCRQSHRTRLRSRCDRQPLP